MLIKNLNFGQKSWLNIEILVEYRNFGRISNFCSKIKIFIQNRNDFIVSLIKFQKFLVEKFFRKIIEKLGKEMRTVLLNFDTTKQARSLVQFVKNRNPMIFNQTVLCIMYDGRKQKQLYIEELKRRTESQQVPETWENPTVENVAVTVVKNTFLAIFVRSCTKFLHIWNPRKFWNFIIEKKRFS